MPRPLQSLFLAFAFLALASVQVIGAIAGFRCDHSRGETGAVIVAASHCHLQAGGETLPCPVTDPGDCDTAALTHSTALTGAEVPAVSLPLMLPGYIPVFLEELPALHQLPELVESAKVLKGPEREPAAGVSIAGQVARCIVLLV